MSQYVKKDPISHILDRPDMYVGSTRSRNMSEYIVTNTEDYKIEMKEIEYSPAILRIFVEPLSNCIDNVSRSKKGANKCTEIRVNIDKETGLTSFWNNGEIIPIEKHPEEKCYNHTLIFGHLLTSSNYDDEDDREDISGRNGLGVKCSAVFSERFTVEGVDPKKKKKFSQTWENNMKTANKPVILKTEEKKGYTFVQFIPDFKQFGITGYTDDILALYYKYVVDASMITKVDFYLNDKLIPVQSLSDYAELYSGKKCDSLSIKTANCDVVLQTSKQYNIISFANGVYTPLGGTHIDSWSEALFRPIVEKLNKPKRPQITIRDVKQYFRLFVVATVKKPAFDSQSKTKLESPSVQAEVKKTHISTILKWPVIEQIEDIIRSKEMMALKKVERKKKYIKVDNLDSANKEGTARSHECTLILVEGLSAKTYATRGIEFGAFGKKGHDWFGIMALRGKVQNCRNASSASIAKNAVVTNIIRALGLKTDLDYTIEENYRKLRYGRVLLICDADVDGIHITGLLQNLFHSLYPSLLQRETPFVTAMQTLIVRVNLGANKSLLFYDENVYRDYVRKNGDKKIDKKYYKGLGTNNKKDIKDSFGKKLVYFKSDDSTYETMNKVFNKKHADLRKKWLESYDPNDAVYRWTDEDYEEKSISISDFLDKELIKYSLDDCARSIPHLLDGLKESQRKVIYATFLRGLKYSGKTLKVAQLAGYVSEKTNYHHGETNLLGTITGLAQSFVGSNNIPLLFRDGEFGTRKHGGKDAANGRYIFTKLDMLTRLIFPEQDDILLSYREDDGDKVEPYFYVPIIPMILVNGVSAGIGTGWSSMIPSYDPIELINAIKIWLNYNGEGVVTQTEEGLVSAFHEFVPYYRGFTGNIKYLEYTKYITEGKLTVKDGNYVITELPIGVWTDDYKQTLEQWKEDKKIKDFDNHSTPEKIYFKIIESDDGFNPNKETLKLTSSIRTSNMCMFDENGKLRKYNTVDEIIDSFCKVRYEYYFRRKKSQLDRMESEIKFLGNKKRFLTEVRDEEIQLFIVNGGKRESRKMEDIVAQLEERGYDKNDNSYDYLLRLQFRSITAEKIEKLKNDIDTTIKEYGKYKETSEKDIWIGELDNLLVEYQKWIEIENESEKKPKKPKKK